ncbi:hypothetical protein MBLNU459_g5723t1 [Dothideomycetes sp. NU459]
MATQSDWRAYSDPNPEWEAAVEKIGGLPDLGNFKDISELRNFIQVMKRQAVAAAGEVPKAPNVHEEDRLIQMRDGAQIAVRVHSPKTAIASGSPLAVIIHGGGFSIGGLDDEQALCRRLVNELGFVCVNVDYRLAPEHPFPAAVHDCWDATQWAAQHVAELKADPRKGFVVGGTSAGGSLTSIVAHLARDGKLSPPLTGLLLMVPSCLSHQAVPEKYKAEYQSYEQNKDAPILGRAALKLFEGTLLSSSVPPSAAAPTPFYVRIHDKLRAHFLWDGERHRNLPPTYFQVCGLDPLRDEALLLERVMREEDGVTTRLSVYQGLPHVFWAFLPQLQCSKDFCDDSVKAVEWLQSFVGE